MAADSPVSSQLDGKLPTKSPVPRPSAVAGFFLMLAIGAFAAALVVVFRSHPSWTALLTSVSLPDSQREWIRPILYGAAGLALFLVFRLSTLIFTAVFPARSMGSKAEGAPSTSEQTEHFVAGAKVLHIDPRISSEAFKLMRALLPLGPEVSCAMGTNDELRSDLHLSEPQIESLLSALPARCDRTLLPVDPANIVSVYDLLHHIESLPNSKAGRFYTRTGLPIQSPPPVTAVSPLANLQNASPRDSRFRTRAHFSGVKRRASDYSGPHRRATDRRSDEDYKGPLRRASDQKSADAQGSDSRVKDRRSSERRTPVVLEANGDARQHRAALPDASQILPTDETVPTQQPIAPEYAVHPAARMHESSLIPLQRQ